MGMQMHKECKHTLTQTRMRNGIIE